MPVLVSGIAVAGSSAGSDDVFSQLGVALGLGLFAGGVVISSAGFAMLGVGIKRRREAREFAHLRALAPTIMVDRSPAPGLALALRF